MDFREKYNEFLNSVEQRMYEYVKSGEQKNLYDPFEYIVSGGGKRIRPVLTLISAGAVGGDPYSAVDPAVAIEILHNFTLVHDDIMDESSIRRGRDTIHIKWSEATAILTGDVMVGHSYKLLPKAKNHQEADSIMEVFTQGLIDVCEGQAMDMEFNERRDVKIEDYLLMIEKKTARLLQTSAKIGAFMGHGNIDEIESLSSYAYNLGMGFQIQDDLLDISADEKQLGKSIGQDIVEGKKTYLILKAMDKAESEADRKMLSDFYENDGLSGDNILKMKSMFERLGILDDAGDEAQKYFNAASEELSNLDENEYTEMLEWLLEALNKRDH